MEHVDGALSSSHQPIVFATRTAVGAPFYGVLWPQSHSAWLTPSRNGARTTGSAFEGKVLRICGIPSSA